MTSVLELAESWARRSKVLILEDDENLAALLQDALGLYDCETAVFSSVKEAVGAVLTSKWDIVFVDLRLPDGSGVELIQVVKAHSPSTPVVVMTGSMSESEIEKALRCGVVAFLRKPYDTNLNQIHSTLAMFKIKARLRAPDAGEPAVA